MFPNNNRPWMERRNYSAWGVPDQHDPIVRIRRDREPMTPFTYRQSFFGVKISHVDGAGVFYIQRENKLQELEHLMSTLPEQVIPHGMEAEDLEGKIVAAYTLIEGNTPTWYRAYVYRILDHVAMVKVILLDYGIRLNVPLRYIMRLPRSIEIIPYFSRRVHLDVNPRCLRGNRWTPSLNRTFADFCKSHHDTVFSVCDRTLNAARVKLTDFGQDVWYDPDQRQWWNGGNITPDFPVVPLRDHELLCPFLSSMGIFIWYQETQTNRTGRSELLYKGVEELFM